MSTAAVRSAGVPTPKHAAEHAAAPKHVPAARCPAARCLSRAPISLPAESSGAPVAWQARVSFFALRTLGGGRGEGREGERASRRGRVQYTLSMHNKGTSLIGPCPAQHTSTLTWSSRGSWGPPPASHTLSPARGWPRADVEGARPCALGHAAGGGLRRRSSSKHPLFSRPQAAPPVIRFPGRHFAGVPPGMRSIHESSSRPRRASLLQGARRSLGPAANVHQSDSRACARVRVCREMRRGRRDECVSRVSCEWLTGLVTMGATRPLCN